MSIHNFGCNSGCSSSTDTGCSSSCSCQYQRPMFCCMGPQVAAGISDYAYFYNLAAQTVAAQGAVTFDVNGPSKGNIVHTAGTGSFTFTTGGTYLIYVRAVALSAARFALYVNGAVVSGGTFSSGTASDVISGMAIVTVPQGAIMTLNNLETEAVSLSGSTTEAGTTTDTVNAEIVALKLA